MSDVRELRMYLIVRGDIEIPAGKLAGQAGHGFATAMMLHLNKYPDEVNTYYIQNQTKIVLRCKNLDALLRAKNEVLNAELTHFLVTDAAHTVFAEPTITCMAIGPCYREDLPKFISKMQLY